VTGELERASETLELYRQAYPRDYRAASNLANVDSMLGHLYVRSKRAGQRVMESVTQFITQRLKLRVKRGEECGGATAETKVSRVQLYGQSRDPARYCAEGLGSV